MKKLFGIALLLGSVISVQAQQSAPQSEKNFNITVTAIELQTIGEALALMPYNKVAPLLQKLQMQFNTQNQPEQPKAEPNAKTPQ